MGTIIDGRLFKQMYPGPYIKVYGEKRHISQLQTGILVDTNLKSEYQIRKLTFTNLENIKKYFDEIKGDIYICRLDIPDEANVVVKTNNFFRTNMCVVQNVGNIWQSGTDIVNFVLENIKIRYFDVIPKKYLTREIIMKYLEHNIINPDDVPKKFLNQEIIIKYIGCDDFNINKMPKKFLNEEIITKYLEYDNFAISMIPKKFLTQEIIMKYAEFGIDGIPKKYLTRKIIERYLKNKKKSCFNHIPYNLITHDMVMNKFCFHSKCLSNIPKNHKTYDFYKKFIKKSGEFRYVPKKFRDSKMCMLAIERCMYGLYDTVKYTIKYMPINAITEEVCKKIIDRDIKAIWHIPEKKITENIAMYHFTKYNIESLPRKYRTTDIYEIAISNNIKNIIYLPDELLSYEYVHELAQKNYHVLKYQNQLRLYKFNKEELYMTAYNNDPAAIMHFKSHLLSYELVKNAMTLKGIEIMEYVSLKSDTSYFDDFIRYMKKNPKLYMVAYENNPKVVVYFPNKLLDLYTKIIENAMSTNGYDILEYLHSIKSEYGNKRLQKIPFYTFLCSNAYLYKYAYNQDMMAIQYFPETVIHCTLLANIMETHGYDILKFIKSKKDEYKNKDKNDEEKDIIECVKKIYHVLEDNKYLYKDAYRNNNEYIQFIPKKFHSYILS